MIGRYGGESPSEWWAMHARRVHRGLGVGSYPPTPPLCFLSATCAHLALLGAAWWGEEGREKENQTLASAADQVIVIARPVRRTASRHALAECLN
jgi:hypothetical protein